MSLVNPIEMLRNYLRVRGEYERSRDTEILSPELPPRARRIRSQGPTHTGSDGTTSACAENTKPPPPLDKPTGNYLRVRGEYFTPRKYSAPKLELPPRARRILRENLHLHQTRGTTSACAENTSPHACINSPTRNYLRVRGEYVRASTILSSPRELPPRARRIQHHENIGGVNLGTTSACAENTQQWDSKGLEHRNYLRVRGEYIQAFRHWCGDEELPPRARRIRGAPAADHCGEGTTSACAENTTNRF